MKPEQAARKVRKMSDVVQKPETVVKGMALIVSRNAKKNTPVLTGTLRRSITARALSPTRGIVGSNVRYAPFVHNGARGRAGRPFLRQGLEQSRGELEDFLRDFGIELLEG